jgi:hypothetical protein
LTTQRDELERKLKTTEEQAERLMAAFSQSAPDSAERRKQERQLQELAREMVDLEGQLLQVKARLLEAGLAAFRTELNRFQAEKEQRVQKRIEALREKAKQRKSDS